MPGLPEFVCQYFGSQSSGPAVCVVWKTPVMLSLYVSDYRSIFRARAAYLDMRPDILWLSIFEYSMLPWQWTAACF